MLVSDLSYSDYFGRQAIGKVINGSVRSKDDLVCIGEDGAKRPLNVSKLQTYAGPKLVEAEGAEPGDIVVLSGIDERPHRRHDLHQEFPKALKRIIVDEPTISMRFSVNTSPDGRAGKARQVTTSKLIERLRKETLKNVSIQVEETRPAPAAIGSRAGASSSSSSSSRCCAARASSSASAVPR